MLAARALHTLLNCLLALVLGLGPLGASALAVGLHAPLCSCTSCDPDASPTSCCGSSQRERSGTVLVAPEDVCRCAVARPDGDASPALAPRATPAERSVRTLLAHGSQVLVRAWCPAPPRPAGARRPEAPPDSAGGLSGVHRACVGARLSALGALRL